MQILTLILIFILSFEVQSNPNNVLKLYCNYDPSLIKKEQRNIGFLKYDSIDRTEICRILSCEDIVEINKKSVKFKGKNEYLLRNSWFNHQGILLDDFSMTKTHINIGTFVSQAYFLDSYSIDRITGNTKRIFYRFDDGDFYYKLKRIEKNKDKKYPLYDEKGKISLQTLKALSLEPWETFYFEGKCQVGTGI